MFGIATLNVFRGLSLPPRRLAAADAEILRMIEKLNGFVSENTNSDDEGTRAMVEMVKEVSKELGLVIDFLTDKKLEEGGSVKYMISDVVEIAHDADLLANNEYLNRSRLRLLLRFTYTVLRETRKRILQLGVEGPDTPPITSSSPPREGGGEYENVVGLEQDVESVLSLLFFNKARYCLPTVFILGMVGVGKSTLARKVYNHGRVVDRYELRAWVCISSETSNKEVLMKLILQVQDKSKDLSVLFEKMENASNESLQWMLQHHLQGKNFLIVLDNIGKIPYLDSIYKALPNEVGKQSRLLLTSRFRRIQYQGPIFQPNISTFEMKPLDGDRSWQLFLKLLLFGNQQFPKKLAIKGREMLRRCDGLPLSIKEVATQFVIKRQSGSKWEELLESPDLSVTLAALKSIYNIWPPLLKSCFLCLSFFNKGTPIRREKLLQVWSAGQVIPHENKEEEETDEAKIDRERSILNLSRTRLYVADSMEGYKTTLVELLDESVIDVDKRKNQHIKRVHVNASFHTLSMAKAEEERVFETLNKGKSNPPSSREPRHRAICCSRDEFNHFTNHDERLFSLFFRGGGYFDASEPYWKRFKQLRTLDFEGFGLKMLPETIGALTELRYLGLRDNYIEKLPQSLGRLKNLETLDIALNFTVEVSDILWDISSLRHLYMSDIICRKPLKIDTLENLETLTYISVQNWINEVSSLKMMTSLRKLGIEEVDENSDASKLFASLADLSNLDCLILRGFRFKSLPSLHGLENLDRLTELKLDGFITKLPSANNFPPQITHLSLINSSLDEDPMPELGKLRHLSYLKLRNAYTGQQMVINRLTVDILCIEELWHLRSIQVDTNSIRLEKLKIKSCPFLENIPVEFFIDQVKEMKMLTTRKFAAKIRKSGFISQIERVDIQP